MTDYQPIEIDIYALVYKLEDMPNSKKEVAKELGISKKELEQVLSESSVYYDGKDGFIRRKLHRDDVGKYQLVFPHAITCEKCGNDIPILTKYYILSSSKFTQNRFCESCIKKKKMLEGLEDEEKSEKKKIRFGRSGSGKTHQMFNSWRK